MPSSDENQDLLRVLIDKLDEKYSLLMAEAEKRNGQRFDAIAALMMEQEKAFLTAMAASDRAVTKAEIAAEKRFESVNEFRKTLSDQTATFLTRNEYMSRHQALSEKVDMAVSRIVGSERKVEGIVERGSGRNDTWAAIAALAAIMISIAAVIVHFVK